MKRILLKIAQFLKLSKIASLVSGGAADHLCRSLSQSHLLTMFGSEAVVRNRPESKKSIVVGKYTLVDGELLVHDYGGKIEIGESTYIGKGSRVWSGESVKIGDRVFVAHNVTITDTNSHQYSAKERAEDYHRRIVEGKPFEKGTIQTAPIIIEDDAWINFGVGVLKGVRIGRGAVVGAMSLVTKDVPSWTLVAGVPAKEIRKIEER